MFRFAMTATITTLSVLLVGCDDKSSMNSSNTGDTIVSIERSGNESGDLSVNLPGFDAKVRIPAEIMTSSKVDIDGVSLFPGSKVSSVKVASGDQPLRMTFEAPADPAKVAAWFQERFADKSVKFAANGNVLSGTTNEGEAFSIALTPAAGGRSTGSIAIGSGKK